MRELLRAIVVGLIIITAFLFLLHVVIPDLLEVRREPESKKQERNGLAYIVNEQTAYTGIIFGKHAWSYDDLSYRGDELKYEDYFKDGKLDGVSKEWTSGQLTYEGSCKAGLPDGVTKVWSENGQLESEFSYKAGKLDGVSKTWYETGQLKSEVYYKAGKLNGVVKMWHENGQLKLESSYKDGNEIK